MNHPVRFEADMVDSNLNRQSGTGNRTMAADIAVSEKTVATPVTREIPDKNAGGRLVSLDAYRGLIMLLLISHALGLIEARTAILQSYPQLSWLTVQVDHSEWTELRFAPR